MEKVGSSMVVHKPNILVKCSTQVVRRTPLTDRRR